jgi:hypothetical protein
MHGIAQHFQAMARIVKMSLMPTLVMKSQVFQDVFKMPGSIRNPLLYPFEL